MIPGSHNPAFSLSVPPDMPIPVLVAVPHAGRDYPASLLRRMRRPEYSKIRLEDRFADQIGAQVARQTGASLLVAHAPRAMLDLNRSPEDMDWEMVEGGDCARPRHSATNRRARSGLGLIPRRLPGLGEIWTGPIERADMDARIEHIHAPYHAALGQTLEKLRDRWGAALLVDLHSMPPLKRAHADDRRAQFVIGDRFGASSNDFLVASALQKLGESGAIVAHNRPYAGGYVLDRHASPGRGIHAMQLEICRSQYLDRTMSDLTPEIGRVTAEVTAMVRTLADDVARLGRSGGLPVAAE